MHPRVCISCRLFDALQAREGDTELFVNRGEDMIDLTGAVLLNLFAPSTALLSYGDRRSSTSLTFMCATFRAKEMP